MTRVIPVLIIIGLALYAFFDVQGTPADRVLRLPKALWMIIALIPLLGAALWFLLGRPESAGSGPPPPRIITLKSKPRPLAPDDDPTFLRRLDEQTWRQAQDRRRAAEQPSEPPEASDESAGA
ncbi:MAG: PLD nuclease N-terminal domain-containing protein [Candidatus Nanopelagicales bacterium]|nr:PLD nuclease N-terminal domain-containing protein [Candidatus Nanopelagicales bacterium]